MTLMTLNSQDSVTSYKRAYALNWARRANNKWKECLLLSSHVCVLVCVSVCVCVQQPWHVHTQVCLVIWLQQQLQRTEIAHCDCEYDTSSIWIHNIHTAAKQFTIHWLSGFVQRLWQCVGVSSSSSSSCVIINTLFAYRCVATHTRRMGNASGSKWALNGRSWGYVHSSLYTRNDVSYDYDNSCSYTPLK